MTSLAAILISLIISSAPADPSVKTPQALDATQISSAQASITADEKRKLPLEFKRALNDEDRAMDHQEKAALKELSVSQNALLKAWRLKEKKERQTFFEQHESGPERRQYVQGYLGRKKAFDQTQKEEVIAAKRSWKDKHEHLKQAQKEREAEFKVELSQDKRPKAELWPQAH